MRKTREKGKAKAKKQKSLKKLVKTFWDAIAKKGVLSCLILSSLDS